LIITNFLGLIFETAFAFSFEISLKPTKIDLLKNPQLEEEMIENPDEVVVPDCNIVLFKCLGEMVGILLYIAVCMVMIMASIDILGSGKPCTCILEFVMVFIFDQAKSVPTQYVIYWVVIRRLGKL
jgi:hypothetical protein